MELLLTRLVTAAIVLGFMILIHELGHYAAAKFFGVRVDVFSIGFGKRIAGFRRGETDYRISALPLGGYVKMAGENPLEARSGAPDEFMSHPRWQRFIIAIAGPFMNILLAVALLTGVFMVRYEHPLYLDQPAVVGWVLENSPAAKAGVEQGDRIVRIEGSQNPTWEDVILKVATSPKQPVDVALQRGNQIEEKKILPDAEGPDQVGTIGWLPDEPVLVTALDPKDGPAARAGLQVGDNVVAVDGHPMRSLFSVIHFLQQNGAQPVDVTAVRNGQQLDFKITPFETSSDDGKKLYRLGFKSDPVHVDKLSFPQALQRSLQENKRYSLLIVDLMQKMLRGKASLRQVEGPIGIVKATGDAVRETGWTPILALTAMISLNLGLFNLLPIPILDGGMVLLLLIESVMRRDISMRIKERIYQTAFVFLLIFAAMVIYNDIMKTLPGMHHMP